jgi:hypothetical protein
MVKLPNPRARLFMQLRVAAARAARPATASAARPATSPPAPAPFTVLILTRFSIRDPSASCWRASADSLFSPARLEAKMRCFERMTAPSVARQRLPAGTTLRWLLFTSPDLPAPYMDRLRSAAARVRGAEVVPVASMAEFGERRRAEVASLRAEGQPPFATVRLDDDDALAETFVQRLARHRLRAPGVVVSFPRGRRYTFSGPKHAVRIGGVMDQKLIALGLACVGADIYACGRHTRIAESHTVVYDAAPDMYLCYCGEHTDTHRPFRA